MQAGTDGRITGVRTADGRHFAADMVVNCAGRWANDAGTASPIPLAPTVGFLAFTPPAPVTLGRVLRTSLVDMRPDGAGRLMLHDNDIDRELTLDSPLSPGMPQAVRMTENAARLFPGLRGLQPEAVRIAARPVPADGYSAIGPVPGKDGYYLAVTHSAVTMSAVLGKLIAGEIADAAEAPELALFRPARFFGANTPPIGGGAEALRHAG